MNWYLKTLKQYADFSGRAGKKEYWMFFLFHMLFAYVPIILGAVLDSPALMFTTVIYVLATLVPSISISVRRMHDVGKSGWYALIPYYNFYLCFQAGELGDNQYGENPESTSDVILQKV